MQSLEYIVYLYTDFPSLNSRAYPICVVGCLLMKDKIGPDGFHSRNGTLSKPGMYVQKGEEGRVFYAFNHYVDFLDGLGRAKSYIDCRVL